MFSSINQTDINEAFGVKVTVSLTTTSKRIKHVHKTVKSLLKQTYLPERIVLWLSEEAYMKDDGISEDEIPRTLKKLTGKGMEIRWTKNTGPYRKLIPSLKEFGGTIITADDDTLYPETWIETLFKLSSDNPGCIVSYRTRMIKRHEDGSLLPYALWEKDVPGPPRIDYMPIGKDGVLYPPQSFDDDIFNTEAYTRLAPTGDDIWYKAMSLKKGTLIMPVPGYDTKGFPVVKQTKESALYSDNKNKNDVYIKEVFDTYNLSQTSPRI